jgi:hypothetical protein
MAAGGFWDLLRIEYVRVIFDRLHYPYYLLTIIGVWKIPCAAVLLAPRLLRLKEWAYAGSVFNYTGAAASHLLAGEGPPAWVGPLVFAVIALGSWALRSPERRLRAAAPPSPARLREWAIAGGLFAVLVVSGLLTLPKGPPPP